MSEQTKQKPGKAFTAHVVGGPKKGPEKADRPETAPSVLPAPKKEPKPGDPSTWEKEIGGPDGPEPTRYGDWERMGICSDF